MSRKTAREHSFKLLYQIDIRKGDEDEVLSFFFEENEVEEKDKYYIEDIVKGTNRNKEEIDSYIGNHTKGWSLNRISKVNMAILRLAVYEMLKREDIPMSVSINEAVELAKNYDSEQAGAFVNGVLGAIQKQLSIRKED